MKHKIWSQHLFSAIFAFVLSSSAIGCLVTGYELPAVSPGTIYLWCAIFAVFTSVLFRFRYGGRILIALTGCALIFIWQKDRLWSQLLEQTQLLSYIITDHYHDVYAWPILGKPGAKEVYAPLILWGSFVSVGTNWHFCRRKHICFAIIPAIIPLVLCLVTTDHVPSTVYLYLIILAISSLLITDWTRRRHPSQGMKLVLRIALPISVTLALLFGLNPKDTYVNKAGEIQKEVIAWFEEFQDTAESVVTGTPITVPVSEKLNLRTVGPKSKISQSVMRVNSPVDGILYLRGRDYDRYTGTGWEASAERTEAFSSGGVSIGELTIVTYGVRNVLYVPYYATKEIYLTGGALDNEENLQRYSYYLTQQDPGNSSAPNARYTELPDDTGFWATELVTQIAEAGTSDRDIVFMIQNYVLGSATYDLSTSRMDSEYDDFAQWFLEESDTGYCVHFATAATVLLRAAGIPARYVEGYMVSCGAESDVVVTNQDAHAWAEYYDSNSGIWRVLEATPADPDDEEPEATLTRPETETLPDEMQAEAETSETESIDREELPTKPNNGQEEVPGTTDDYSGNPLEQGKEKEPFKVPEWIITSINLLLLAGCIPLQAYARIYWKRMLWNRGKPNESTMTRWRQTRSLAKLLKQPYPEELDNLAQKAKFSQHRIQPEELRQFEDYRQSLVAMVAEKPWHHRMIFKWIFAID